MSEGERSYRWQTPAEPVATVQDEGFLGRWSRRKRLARQGMVEPEPEPPADATGEAAAIMAAPREVAPAQGDEPAQRPLDELTDEDMPPLESLTDTSDVSMFMSRQVSAALRMKALSRVFHSSRYNKICLCAEYAEDYNQYTPLGSIVPHDLKTAIAREAESLRERLLARGQTLSFEDAQARIVAEREAGVSYSVLGPVAGETADGQQEEGEGPEQSA
jgi:hypothetical protein